MALSLSAIRSSKDALPLPILADLIAASLGSLSNISLSLSYSSTTPSESVPRISARISMLSLLRFSICMDGLGSDMITTGLGPSNAPSSIILRISFGSSTG